MGQLELQQGRPEEAKAAFLQFLETGRPAWLREEAYKGLLTVWRRLGNKGNVKASKDNFKASFLSPSMLIRPYPNLRHTALWLVINILLLSSQARVGISAYPAHSTENTASHSKQTETEPSPQQLSVQIYVHPSLNKVVSSDAAESPWPEFLLTLERILRRQVWTLQLNSRRKTLAPSPS